MHIAVLQGKSFNGCTRAMECRNWWHQRRWNRHHAPPWTGDSLQQKKRKQTGEQTAALASAACRMRNTYAALMCTAQQRRPPAGLQQLTGLSGGRAAIGNATATTAPAKAATLTHSWRPKQLHGLCPAGPARALPAVRGTRKRVQGRAVRVAAAAGLDTHAPGWSTW